VTINWSPWILAAPVVALLGLVAIGFYACDSTAYAQTTTAKLKLTFIAPHTNTDGSPLVDLAGYRIFIKTSPGDCTGTYKSATTSKPAPVAGTKVTKTYSGFAWSTRYYVRVQAVDLAGNVSACSEEASAVTNAPSTTTGLTLSPA
jgi:hypothetical protein